MAWNKTTAAVLMLVLACRPGWAEDAKAGLAEFVGAETCLSCHSDHKTFEDNLHVAAMKNAKGIEFSKTCETCHGPGSLHAAAAGDRSNSDFYTIKNPSKLKGAAATAICLSCHQGGKRMHWQSSAHEAKNVTCTNCHSMHDVKANKGDSPLLAKAGQAAETCYQCHADKKAQIEKSAHMPIKEGKMDCTSCHDPHGSGADKLMVKASVTDTCFQCHQDKRGPYLWEHPPVRENCLNCHNPHGSHNDKMLVTKAPALCQRCHVAGHPASFFDLVTLNKDSARLLDRGCVNCHSRVHGSNHPSGKFFQR